MCVRPGHLRLKKRRLKVEKFRLEGLVRGEPEVQLLDAQGGGTVTAPILKKDGTLRKNSPAVSEQQFELLNLLPRKYKRWGQSLKRGGRGGPV